MGKSNKAKGSVTDYLKKPAWEITKLSDNQLRGIVNKLSDVANKRLRNMAKTGFGAISPAYRQRMGKNGPGFFQSSSKATRGDLITNYAALRGFLKSKTATISGAIVYNRQFEPLYKKLLGGPFDEKAYDRRYKKKKVLKKSVARRLRNFWEKYDQWRELKAKNDPESVKGDTNLNNVEEFEEEVYSQGKANVSNMDKMTKDQYKQREKKYNEEPTNEEEQNKPVQPPTANGRGAERVTPVEQKAKQYGKVKRTHGIKERFEAVSIFGDEFDD